MRSGTCGVLVLLAIATAAAPARSQQPDDVSALAEQLFREGKQLMADGRTAEACPKLAESQRLDPAGGTLLTLALCHEAAGKTASAWAAFQESVATGQRDGRADREAIAKEHLAALEPRLCRLHLVVGDDVAKLPGLRIRRDGVDLGPVTWNADVPVDPGHHTIEVTAERKLPFEQEVDLAADGASARVEIPALADAPPPPPEPRAAPPPAPPPLTPDRGASQRTVALVFGGAAVAALGAGAVLGGLALSNQSEADRRCPNTACSDAGAVELSKSAGRDADWATVAFTAGGALAVTAVSVWFTAPRAQRTRASLRVGPGGAAVRGGF